MQTPEALWQQCLDLIKSHLNQQQYSTFFEPVRFYEYDEAQKTLILAIPSEYFFEYLEANYRVLIYRAIYHVFGTDTQLKYKVSVVGRQSVDHESPKPADDKPKSKKPQAEGLDSQLIPDLTFSTFIEGEANRLSRSVGLSVAEHPTRKTFNPLFIYGPSGCGKTHLANAIGLRLKDLHPRKRVLYLSAHTFQVQYTDSVRQNKRNDFFAFYQSIDVLILDDIQEFAGQEKTIETFFHIFNHLHQNGRQIILTSDRAPASLKGFEDRMLTRFKWGLEAEMFSPDRQLRHDILLSMVKRDGLDISDSVIDYVADNVEGSIRELEGMIHSLLAYSLLGNNKISLAFARQMLQSKTHAVSQDLTMDDIMSVTCKRTAVKQADILSSSRQAGIVTARQIIMYLADKYTDLTLKRIGLLLGNRTHSTVMHGVKIMKQTLTSDATVRKLVRDIEKELVK